MTKTLKQQNRPHLIMFLVANVVALAAIIVGVEAASSAVESLKQGESGQLLRLLAIPGLMGLVASLGTWLIPTALKESLVSWKRGVHRLPSSRAFSEVAKEDPRVNIESLKVRHGPFPRTAADQSAKWYSIYRQHAAEASVVDSHRASLLYRDMNALWNDPVFPDTVLT